MVVKASLKFISKTLHISDKMLSYCLIVGVYRVVDPSDSINYSLAAFESFAPVTHFSKEMI
jgi:hypothetical protein